MEKHWSDIKSYKQILSKQNTLDICNTESYLSKNLPENSISLVLFIDAAPFADSSNGSVWEIFGFIANLPPRLRARFSNILKILSIEGRLFSFNGVFEKQMENFKSLLSNRLKMKLDTEESITIQINTHAVITDEPGRAKTCNCKQHNGWHGCFYCLNQGVAVGKKLRCYPGINSTTRTPELYRNHVQFSLPHKYTKRLNVYSCVYSANLFPFIQRIYFGFYAAFFAVLTQGRVPYGNAVRTCTYMWKTA